MRLFPALNCLRIALIVLRVRTNETDIHDTIGIVNPNHQPVFIPGKIEYDPAFFQDAGAFEVCLSFNGRCPVSF